MSVRRTSSYPNETRAYAGAMNFMHYQDGSAACGCESDCCLDSFDHQENSKQRYEICWSDWLGKRSGACQITSVVWQQDQDTAATATPLRLERSGQDGRYGATAYVYISGGEAGYTYRVWCEVTTDDCQTHSECISIKVKGKCG